MVQQNELITLLVGTGTVIFILLNRVRIRRIPGSGLLLLAFFAFYAGWVITVFEAFLLPRFMNVLEHACYMTSSMAAAAWSWLHVFNKGAGK
ncbi:MAG: hypothetical protein PVJ01_06470 [Pseudomonadota bacterium]|jgi:hypothetical protein